jgi:hypothetical protein
VLDEGTTFVFDSWIFISNGFGGFNSHPANSRKLEASTPTRRSDLDEFIDNLDELLLPDLVWQIEKISIFDATSTRGVPELVRLNSNQSKETTQSESLSNLEEDLDCLLNLKDEGATDCRGAAVSSNCSDSNEEYFVD